MRRICVTPHVRSETPARPGGSHRWGRTARHEGYPNQINARRAFEKVFWLDQKQLGRPAP